MKRVKGEKAEVVHKLNFNIYLLFLERKAFEQTGCF